MRTPELLMAIRERHREHDDGWVVVEEMWRIDALVFSVWARGAPAFPRIAYEVKVSRNDFLNEIRRPEKSAFAMEIADFFVFAAPVGLVAAEEVPERCGLVEFDGEAWHETVPAVWLEPRELTRAEWADLLQRRVAPGYVRALKQKLERQVRFTDHLVATVDRLRGVTENEASVVPPRWGSAVTLFDVWQSGRARGAA